MLASLLHDSRFRPGRLAALALIVAVSGQRADACDTEFTLGFSGPSEMILRPGDRAQATFYATLEQEDPHAPGVQGWSISLTAESTPPGHALVTAITIDGTDARDGFHGGFETSQVTRGENNVGAVSAVVPSHVEITMPSDRRLTIARFIVDIVGPIDGGVVRLIYRDGFRGSGSPVWNSITQSGDSCQPILTTHELALRAPAPWCGEAVNAGFSLTPVSSPTPFRDLVGTGVDCVDTGRLLVHRAPLGATRRLPLFVNAVSRLDPAGGRGIEGWSIGVEIGEGLEILDAAARFDAPRAPALAAPFGFEHTAVVDPAPASGRRGVVSAVVLDFSARRTLPPQGTESLLRIDLAGGPGPAGEPRRVRIALADGLTRGGEPVRNLFVVDGEGRRPANIASVAIDVSLEASPRFLRADANADGTVHIADPIFTLGALFLGSETLGCRDAADADDNGRVDVTDVIATLGFLFLGRPPPPAPFPDCGLDTTEDAGDCDATSSVCS